MEIGRSLVDGVWRTGAVKPPPLVQVDGDQAPDFNSILDRIQEQLDEIREQLDGKAAVEHEHALAEIDGSAVLLQRIAALSDRLAAADELLAGKVDLAVLDEALLAVAPRDHRHGFDDIDDGGQFVLLDEGLVPRAVIPALSAGDLPSHGHRAVEISGLGSAATHEAHTIEDLARRVATLEQGG